MSTITVPTTLTELADFAAASETDFSEVTASTDKFEFSREGLIHEGQVLRMDQACRNRVFRLIEAPVSYLENHSTEFQALALAERLAQGDFQKRFKHGLVLVRRRDELVTFARADLNCLSNSNLLTSVIEGLNKDSDELLIKKIGLDDDRLELELLSPSKAITVRPGDVVQSGIYIKHNRFGGPATTIEAFIYRLICSNGMVRRECAGDVTHRTRRQPANRPNGRELQMAQIRELTKDAWDGLQAKLNALRATNERHADVERLLTRWLQRARLSVRLMLPRMLAAWHEEGGENTEWAAINAITRVATHHPELRDRQRRVLASLAGLLAFAEIHLCPACYSVLAGADADDRLA